MASSSKFFVILKERPLAVFRESFPSYPLSIAADAIPPALPAVLAAFEEPEMLHLVRVTVPLWVYLPCWPAPNCLGKQGELSEKCVPNLTIT